MKIVLYNSLLKKSGSIDEFLDAIRLNSMPYLASDLLKKGINAEDITEAIKKAINVLHKMDFNAREHFKRFYTNHNGQIIKDCKLSKLGYVLVILNLNSDSSYIANIQLSIAEYFFSEYDIEKF